MATYPSKRALIKSVIGKSHPEAVVELEGSSLDDLAVEIELVTGIRAVDARTIMLQHVRASLAALKWKWNQPRHLLNALLSEQDDPERERMALWVQLPLARSLLSVLDTAPLAVMTVAGAILDRVELGTARYIRSTDDYPLVDQRETVVDQDYDLMTPVHHEIMDALGSMLYARNAAQGLSDNYTRHENLHQILGMLRSSARLERKMEDLEVWQQMLDAIPTFPVYGR